MRSASRGRAHPALLLVPVLLGAAACGLMSREADVRRALADPELDEPGLRRVLGADPTVAPAWMIAARGAGTPDATLETLADGRAYLPFDVDLRLTRAALLARAGRGEDLLAETEALLGRAPPRAVEAGLRWLRLDAHLAEGRLDAAFDECTKLCAIVGDQPELGAGAFARTALAFEFDGRRERADEALARSLDFASGGTAILVDAIALEPDLAGPARALMGRALERRPRHPDLLAFDALMRLEQGRLQSAARSLEELDEVAPPRLRRELLAMQARHALASGRIDEGLDLLRSALDRAPSDPLFVGVMLEAYRTRKVPDADELRARLDAALARLPPGLVRDQARAVRADLGDG